MEACAAKERLEFVGFLISNPVFDIRTVLETCRESTLPKHKKHSNSNDLVHEMVPLQISFFIHLSVNGAEFFFLTENFTNAVVSPGQPNVTQKQPGVDQKPEWSAQQASNNNY